MDITKMQITVTKRNGSTEQIDVNKINKSVERACEGITDVSASEIVLDASIQLYNNVKTSEIDKSLIMSARSKIEKEPNYSTVAARLLLNCVYKEVFQKSIVQERLDEEYRATFKKNILTLIDLGRLNKSLGEIFDLETLSSALLIENDKLFEYVGIQTLVDRYFLRDNDVLMETPQAFFMRVAMGLCLKERNSTEQAIVFYKHLSNFDYMTSTPTLFNSGTVRSQLASCFLSSVHDSEDGIMGTIHDQARLSKYAGGLGVDITSIRASGSKIKGTDGRSSGPIPFLKILNDTVLAFDQGGGKRKGSCVVDMEPWHLDFEEFLELRKNTGDERRRCHDLHTAAWIPDLFMEKVEKNEDWYLFCPNEAKMLHETYGEEFNCYYEKYTYMAQHGQMRHKVVKAKDLMKKMLTALFETGHPWPAFKDTSNKAYMQKKYILRNPNLCREILRHTIPTIYERGQKSEIGETAVCVLASINGKSHLLKDKKDIDWVKLQKSVVDAVRSLDNVIDSNYYPTLESEKSNIQHRPIGLGFMGFNDVLNYFEIPYDSEDAVILSEQIQQFIYYYALKASADLAIERGPFPTFKDSEWAKGVMHHDLLCKNSNKDYLLISDTDLDILRQKIVDTGIRNANVLAIAPNATISYICGCSQSIEPDYSVLFTYTTLSGQFTMTNRWFVDKMKELDLWNEKTLNDIKSSDGDIQHLNIPDGIKKMFKTVFQLDYKYLIDCASARQKWIDMGQSFNLYCDIPSLKKLYDMYHYAWKKELKTTYYLRTVGASKNEKTTVEPQASACSIEAARRGEVCESCT